MVVLKSKEHDSNSCWNLMKPGSQSTTYTQHSPQNGYIGYYGVILKIMDKTILSNDMHFLIKCFILPLEEDRTKVC